jgi:hypothetical protein
MCFHGGGGPAEGAIAVFGRGWLGLVAYLEGLFDGPWGLLVALLVGLVVVRLLLLLLSGHGLAAPARGR